MLEVEYEVNETSFEAVNSHLIVKNLHKHYSLRKVLQNAEIISLFHVNIIILR